MNLEENRQEQGSAIQRTVMGPENLKMHFFFQKNFRRQTHVGERGHDGQGPWSNALTLFEVVRKRSSLQREPINSLIGCFHPNGPGNAHHGKKCHGCFLRR